MSIVQYKKLYELTSKAQCADTTLNNIKRHYEHKIRSKRTLSRINTLKELLEILEKRDCISPDNVAPLKDIGSRLGIDYREQTVRSPESTNERTNLNAPVLGAQYYWLKERVHQKIVDNIGHSWRDFGRHLKVPHGRLDDLEERYPKSVSNRTHEILRFHDETYVNNRNVWKTKLLNALVDARRKDIKLDLEQIFDTHNLNY